MSQLETRRFYRRLIGACAVVGAIAYIVLMELGYVLVGTAVYWACFLGMIGIWKGTGIELYDEREQQIEHKAVGLTMTVFAFVLVLGGPGLFALESAGHSIPSELWGAFYGYCALFLVFGVIYTAYRYRP